MIGHFAFWFWTKFSSHKLVYSALGFYAIRHKRKVYMEFTDKLSTFKLDARDDDPPDK